MDGDLNQTGDESPPVCLVPLCSTKLRSDGESGKSRTTDSLPVVITTAVRQTQSNEAAAASWSPDAGVFTFSPPELRRTGNKDNGILGVLTVDDGSTSSPIVSVCLPLPSLVASPILVSPADAFITHVTSRETASCTADDLLQLIPKMTPANSIVFGGQDLALGQVKTGNKADIQESRIFSNHKCKGKEGETEDKDQATSSASPAPTMEHVGKLSPRAVTGAGDQSSWLEPRHCPAAAPPVKTEQQWQQATDQVTANTKTAVAPAVAGVTLPDVLVADQVGSGSDEEDEDELPLMVDLGSTPEYTAAAATGGSAAATATIEASSETEGVDAKNVCSTINADPESAVTVIVEDQLSVKSNPINALPSDTESSVSIHATPVGKASGDLETGDAVSGSSQAPLPGPPGVAYAAAGACATPPLVVIASPLGGSVKDMTGRAMLTTAIAVGAVTSQPAASCAPPVSACQTRSGRPINASGGASVTTSAGGGLLCGGFSRPLRPLAPAIGGFSSASSSGVSFTVTPSVMSTTTAQPAVQLLPSAFIAAGSSSSSVAAGSTSLTPFGSLAAAAPTGQPVALSAGSSLATPLAPPTLQLFNMAPAVTATPLPQFIGGPSILFHTASTAPPTAFPVAANPATGIAGGASFAGQPLGSFLSPPAPTLQPPSSLAPAFLSPVAVTTPGSTFLDSSSLYPTFFHPPASSCFLVASSASASLASSSSSNTVSYSVSAGAASAALSGKVCSTGMPPPAGLFWPPISLSGSSALTPVSNPTLMPSCIFPPFSLPFPTPPDCCLQSHTCLPSLMTTTNTNTVAAGCYQPANFRIACEPELMGGINNSIASTVGTPGLLSCSSTAPPTPLVLTPANNALCHPGGACALWSAATSGGAASVALQCTGSSGSSTALLTPKLTPCAGGCPLPPVTSLGISLPQPPVLQPCPLISPGKPLNGVYTAGIPPLVARPTPPPPPTPPLAPSATASVHLGPTTTAAGSGGIRAPNSTLVMPALRRRRPIARSGSKLLSLVNGLAGKEATVAVSSKAPVQPIVPSANTRTAATTVPASSVCDSQIASLTSVSSVSTTTATDAGSLQSNVSSGSSHCQLPSAVSCSSSFSSCAPAPSSSPTEPVVVVVDSSSGSPVALSSSSCKWPFSSASSVTTTDSSRRSIQSSGQKESPLASSQGHSAGPPLTGGQAGAVRCSGDWPARDEVEAVEEPMAKGTCHVPTTSRSSPPPSSSLPTGFSPASSSPAETSVDSNLSSSSFCTSSGSSSSLSSSSCSGSSSSPVAVPSDPSKEEQGRLCAAAQGKRSTTSAVHRRHLRRDETGREEQQAGGRAALPCSSGTLVRGYPQSPGAGSNGRRILTHFIDGHVIYESNQPFPVKNGMAVVEAALLVQCIKEKEEQEADEEVVVVPQPPHRHWHQPVPGRGGHARKSTLVGSRTAATICSRQQVEQQSSEASSSSSSRLFNGRGDYSPPSRRGNSCQATPATTGGRGGVSAAAGSEVVRQSTVVGSTSSSPRAEGEESRGPPAVTTTPKTGGGAAPDTVPHCLNGSSQQARHLPAPAKASQAVMSKSPPPARPGAGVDANQSVDTNPLASQGPVASTGCFTSCAAHHHQQHYQPQPPVHSSTYQQSTGLAPLTPTMPCAGLPPGPVRQWSTQDVVAFVTSIPGCGAYAPAFLANEVDGEALLYLTEDQFIQPPINMKIGPALKLAARLEILLRQA